MNGTRKLLILAVLLPLVASVAAWGTGADETNKQGSTKPATIKMFIPAPETQPFYNAIIAEYKKVRPNITLVIESNQTDFVTLLKSRLASGDVPDIFGANPGTSLREYTQYAADISDLGIEGNFLPGMLDGCSINGKLHAVTYTFNSTCMIYNKALFEKAGITEVPLTFSALKAASGKLKAAGITPFVTPFKEWWINKHIAQYQAFAANNGDVARMAQMIEDLNGGKKKFSDFPKFADYTSTVDFLVANGVPKQLEIDFSAAAAAFASEKAAMIVGVGDWAEPVILGGNASIKMGLMGLPLTENAADAKIATEAPLCWVVCKDSKVLPETKAFVKWLFSSEFGKKALVETMNYITTLKGSPVPGSELAKQLVAKAGEGKTFPNYFYLLIGDTFSQKFGEDVQSYIAGSLNKEQFRKQVDTDWEALRPKK